MPSTLPFHNLITGISEIEDSDNEARDQSKPVMTAKKELIQQPDIDKEKRDETAEETKPQTEAMNAETSEWDSSSEEVSAPKPVLANLGKNAEKKMGGSLPKRTAKEEFDFDTSEATSEFSSPEQAKKMQKVLSFWKRFCALCSMLYLKIVFMAEFPLIIDLGDRMDTVLDY